MPWTPKPRRLDPEEGVHAGNSFPADPALWEYSLQAGERPSTEYLSALLADIEADGYRVELDDKGGRHLVRTRPGAVLRQSVRDAAVRHAEALGSHVRGLRGLPEPNRPQAVPDRDGVIEVLKDDGTFVVCCGHELPPDWVRWSYLRRLRDRQPRRWFAYSGDTWETG